MTRPVTAPISDVQRFSIHDGPGIRTLVFFKGCNLRCRWCQNPESQDRWPVIAFHASRCRERFDCAAACGEGAIRRQGFRVDPSRCTLCGDCVEACAQEALRRIGEELTPEQLMERVLRDAPYFGRDGGVTLSGGEPTLYPEFIDRLLDLCAARGVGVALETAGLFRLDRWLPLLERFVLIYFDLKILDAAGHERAVGRGGLETILENGRRLGLAGLPVEFRMPLVPGYTDTPENLDRAIAFLRSVGHRKVHLLEYHRMGEAKIDIIDGDQPRLGLARLDATAFADVVRRFEAAGIELANRTPLLSSRP